MSCHSRWLAHTPMTDPAALSSSLEKLPSDVATLNRVVQGLLVHGEWLGKYGVDRSSFGLVSRTTLPVKQRLAELLERERRELTEARLPTQRVVGTCRDFALMLCTFLRATGTAARLRCGFASYLGEGWEDHWVCEVPGTAGRTNGALVTPNLMKRRKHPAESHSTAHICPAMCFSLPAKPGCGVGLAKIAPGGLGTATPKASGF